MEYREYFAPESTHPLLKGLSSSTLTTLYKSSILHSYKPRQHILEQADTPTHLYIIAKGRLRTFRTNKEGNETTIDLLGTNEVCMESAVFTGEPAPFSIQTLEACDLILIPKELIQSLVLLEPLFAANILRILTQHHKAALHQIDGMAIKSPVQRVGYYLLDLYIKNGSSPTGLELPFKKSLIANHLGMTPETFSRALSKIKASGIKVDNDKILMSDAFALCHFCDLEAAHHCTRENKLECAICPLHSN